MRYLIALGMFIGMNVWAGEKFARLREECELYCKEATTYRLLVPAFRTKEKTKAFISRGEDLDAQVVAFRATIEGEPLEGKILAVLEQESLALQQHYEQIMRDVFDLHDECNELCNRYNQLSETEQTNLQDTLLMKQLEIFIAEIEEQIVFNEWDFKCQLINTLRLQQLLGEEFAPQENTSDSEDIHEIEERDIQPRD